MRKLFIVFFAISSVFAISTKKIYNVDGMMCGFGCVSTISNTLKILEGVEEFSIDFETKKRTPVYECFGKFYILENNNNIRQIDPPIKDNKEK